MLAPLSPVVVVSVVSFIEMSIAFEMLKCFRLPRTCLLPLLKPLVCFWLCKSSTIGLSFCCLRRVPKCHSGNKKVQKAELLY